MFSLNQLKTMLVKTIKFIYYLMTYFINGYICVSNMAHWQDLSSTNGTLVKPLHHWASILLWSKTLKLSLKIANLSNWHHTPSGDARHRVLSSQFWLLSGGSTSQKAQPLEHEMNYFNSNITTFYKQIITSKYTEKITLTGSLPAKKEEIILDLQGGRKWFI